MPLKQIPFGCPSIVLTRFPVWVFHILLRNQIIDREEGTGIPRDIN
jgi:hypothetical protein